jgi:hypothetical protein
MDSALLLRRIGFLTLGVALPVAAMASRRAAVVLVPIGIVLLVIAALIVEPERFRAALWRGLTRTATLALILLAGWSALSLAWGMQAVAGPERALNLALALWLGWMGVAALPERGRAADLNIVSAGLGVAALLAAGSTLTGTALSEDVDGITALMRGLSLVAMLAGPAIAWLLSRGRTRTALGLGLAIAGTVAVVGDVGLLLALIAAALAFGVVLWRGARATGGLALALAALVLAAPALPFLLMPPLRLALGEAHALVTSLNVWAATMLIDPIKLLTGHGLATTLRDQPGTVLFQIWRELGLVGAFALAAAVFYGVRALRRLPVLLQAGGVAAYVTAFGLGLMGVATFRPWWLMTLVAAIVLTTLIARGQPRTDRPLARFVESARRRATPAERPVVKLREAQAATEGAPAASADIDRPSATA